MKIGIFGGTFDPMHLGHLRTVQEAAHLLALDRVLLIPSARPPHKHRPDMTAFSHRLEMTCLAAEDNALLEVLDIEGKRSGPSYSVDTLESLRRRLGPEAPIYFLMGMDAFLDIRSWHQYSRLFDLAHFVVIERAGSDEDGFLQLIGNLGTAEAPSPGAEVYTTAGGNTIRRLSTTLMDISGTGIRRLVRSRQSIRYLVTEPVRRYILGKGLYVNGAGA